ncbi:Endonuclease/exonuclease/phosphatase [Lanmaoa asiatica]|nr:Endonuclease/exonuclease/phosphatase [Lanmaoa asiatica]
MMTSHSGSVVIEHAPPVIPPRTRPGAPDLSQSPSEDISTEMSSPGIVTMDASPRRGNVTAMLGRFASKDVSKLRRDDNASSHSEPNILITSPPIYRVRHPPPRPLNSALFAREDGLDLPSRSSSSLHSSPFSDDESEISEISDVSLPPALQPQKTSGCCEFASANGIYSPQHDRKLSGSSSESLSSFSPPSKPRPPPRPASHAPPRPPRRPNGLSGPQEPSLTSSATTTPTPSIAPPLPSRRVTEESALEALSPAPPLPARVLTPQNIPVEFVSPVGERKPFGSGRLPPPPTRTIGLGDRLPPMRHAPSPSSDEESASEEDPRARSVESLPDSSHSSRRPPSMPSVGFMEYKMHVPAHSGHVAVAGSGVVVASGHHIKYYDLFSNDGPSWTLDTKDGMRGSLVTCLEFRPAHDEADRGKYLWVGTKDGHLLEVDVRMGAFTSSKMGIHASQVTNISRHGSTMITVDEAGKTFIFDPDGNASTGVGASLADDVNLVYTAPRVYRLGEKAEFVKLLGGLLWTAVRTDVNGVGTASVPVIRIYDIYAPGSIGRPVMPSQHAGAVTSGTILPSHLDHVYLGHEGGYISIWNVATDDGIPACVEVVKVSASDVLCLEGVSDRLWAGGRKGAISVYDVSVKPWVVTNCWDAHGGLPVSRIFVDPYAIVEMERLRVVSVGRDEQIRFWDGLLGADRVEQELLKREHTFSTFRDLKVLIVSWNVDAAKPESLIGDPENLRFLHDVLTSVDSPDIISFGFQELIDLESRKMAAKTVLLGGKKKGDEGKINEKVTSSYKKWHDRLIQAVKLAMPPESPYTVIHTESLVGLFTCMFIKNTEKSSLKDAAIATIKRGMGGRYGNKGGILARFVIDDSSLCFINCHLAAGQHHVRQRNADVAAFLEETNVFPSEPVEEFGYVGGGDGSMVLDHEIVFLNGDMNYRIDQRRDAVVAAIQANDLDTLLTHDQLHKEMKHNRAFRLRPFCEGPLTFAPTYKYDRNSNAFDTSEKRRVPAWCDRVLWRSRDEGRVALMEYRRWEVNVSDHRPVSAAFRVTVKRVVGEARERERRVMEGWWRGMEVALLSDASAFYVSQAVV